ncbi:hypothetical protein FRZ03_33270 [Streptomyces misionensis]|uniref:Uncharacterized protein n=1 Tax=Streptomyces misionensis TaxID=67331 RepID=A0A5C6IVK4_9ACTN|nr:hypothetical protein [Streptomyces misionensis]TWV32562.1 hypothetical protein FRZ03_33270 [Streptomyces misionensis]
MPLPIPSEQAELIEIVRILDPLRHYRAEDVSGEETGVWEGAEAVRALALIADLPDGDLHRCFNPGWGVRVHGTDGPLFRLAFCFECHGVRLWGPAVPAGQEGIHGFDADSAPARELLRRFRATRSGAPGSSGPVGDQ